MRSSRFDSALNGWIALTLLIMIPLIIINIMCWVAAHWTYRP